MAASGDQRNEILPGLHERNGLAREVSVINAIITKVPERNRLAHEVSETDRIISEVSERNGLACEVSITNEIITEVPERNRLAHEVSETDGIISKVPERNSLAHEVSENDGIISEVPERNGLAREVSVITEIITEVPERNGLAREVSETDEITREMPERSDVIQEEINVIGGIQEPSHGGAICQKASPLMTKHNFSFRFLVLNLGEEKSACFQAYFDTDCGAVPTFWICEMIFERVADDGTACIIFKLKRTDDNSYEVKLDVCLDIKDSTARPLFGSSKLQRLDFNTGGELLEAYLIRKFQTPEEASNFNSKLDVNIDILISYCHLLLEVDGETWIF